MAQISFHLSLSSFSLRFGRVCRSAEPPDSRFPLPVSIPKTSSLSRIPQRHGERARARRIKNNTLSNETKCLSKSNFALSTTSLIRNQTSILLLTPSSSSSSSNDSEQPQTTIQPSLNIPHSDLYRIPHSSLIFTSFLQLRHIRAS